MPLTAASEKVLSAFLRVSLVASTALLSARAVEERERMATERGTARVAMRERMEIKRAADMMGGNGGVLMRIVLEFCKSTDGSLVE